MESISDRTSVADHETEIKISLDAARDDAILAQYQFTELTDTFGSNRTPAHVLFNKRVSRWSNGFTNKCLRKYLYTLGRLMTVRRILPA